MCDSRESVAGWAGPSTLNLDIVDYPGEWLLDLPLLSLSFAEWSAQALARAAEPTAPPEARAYLELLAAIDTAREIREPDAERPNVRRKHLRFDNRSD